FPALLNHSVEHISINIHFSSPFCPIRLIFLPQSRCHQQDRHLCKNHPYPFPWQKVVILKNQGGSVFPDGICITADFVIK
ncbi:MAG: hypothetical protein IIV41_01805, partial [Akkermansia sp.]|nr:hypothetical protein [Akkermansia sp.]